MSKNFVQRSQNFDSALVQNLVVSQDKWRNPKWKTSFLCSVRVRGNCDAENLWQWSRLELRPRDYSFSTYATLNWLFPLSHFSNKSHPHVFQILVRTKNRCIIPAYHCPSMSTSIGHLFSYRILNDVFSIFFVHNFFRVQFLNINWRFENISVSKTF